MTLETFWFCTITVLWIGFFVLEGFDFGVGMLFGIIGKGDVAETEVNTRRRVLLNTIGPVWDGNEVWLLTAAGAMFAAFPAWYATVFSGFYLAMLLILIALIVRNLGFEYRHKRDSHRWRRNWDRCIMGGSLVPPLLLGIALTNLVRGLPITKDANQDFVFTGNLFTLFNPISVLGGITFVALSLTHGSHFVALKTTDDVRSEARSWATKFGIATIALAIALVVSVNVSTGEAASWALGIVAMLALAVAVLANTRGREGWAFLAGSLAWLGLVACYFVAIFPNLIESTTNAASTMTVHNAASSHLTLQIMTGAALVFTPIAIGYSAWNYWVFRKRISPAHIPAAHDPLKIEH